MSNFNAFWVTVGNFYTANKDIINTVLSRTPPTLLIAGITAIWWYRQQRRKLKFSVSSSPFECIPPHSEVLQRVYSGDKDSPLADFNIPYQSRQTDRDICQELERELEKTGWLLILGRTGIGKTREAAELVQDRNREGWTVLRLKVGAWVDEPTQEQLTEIGTNRKLLFFLDDLNQPMHFSRCKEISPKAKDSAFAPINDPLQKRLLKTLEAYEEFCGKEEMRVIATARNESQPGEPGKPSELEKLQFEKYPKLWQRFTMYELSQPSDEAMVRLLDDVVPQTHLYAKPENYSVIVKRNDGTFRNLVENLVRLENRNLPLTPENYQHSLQGTWEKRYQDAVKRYPISPYIYDAIELLRQCNLPLQRVLIEPTALLFLKGQFWQRWLYRWKIRQALIYLIEAENILNPRDGQIEAKGKPVDVEKYILPFTHLLLDLTDSYPSILFYSLLSFGSKLVGQLNDPNAALAVFDKLLKLEKVITKQNLKTSLAISGGHSQALDFIYHDPKLALLHQHKIALTWLIRGLTLVTLGCYEKAIASYDKAVEIEPNLHEAWYHQGNALGDLRRYEEAIASYDKTLEIKPNLHEAWYKRGNALVHLGCYEEAIASYDKAVEIEPNLHEAWYIRGNALAYLGRYEKAIASYDKAVEIQPDYHEAWNNRGYALGNLGRYEEAIASYDKALKIQPDDHVAWNTYYNRGSALDDLGRYEEAIASYDKALEIQPDDHVAWYIRGNALGNLGRYEEAIASFDKALEIKPDYPSPYYNKACCYALQGNTDLALENLQHAIHLNPDEYRQMAETNSDFDSIRGDSRFQMLIQGRSGEK